MSRDVFVELELNGPALQAVGFVEGYRLGAGHPGPVWFTDRERVAAASFLEAVREKMHLETHVIAPRELTDALVEALAATPVLELHAGEAHEVASAELAFELRCYARETAAEVRRLVEDDLPEGVRLESYEVEEKELEDAQGVELYSPVHHYTLTGAGRYVGTVPGIVELARRLAGQEFVHPARVRLHLRD